MTNGSTVGMEARGHAVHLSDDPSYLTVRVGEYLAAAVANGGVAVAAVAPTHLRALELALPTHGVDVASALREGTLVLLDAEDARHRLVESGSLDPRVFQAIVGDVVRRHARPGRPTHVYGEIVALLWRDGLVAEALELETLWNALAEDVSFSLLCAYPTHLVAADGWREALDRVCSLHTSVTGRPDELAPSWTGQLEADDVSTRWFPCSSLAPKAAREFVADIVGRWGYPALVTDAALVTSELATNAFLHAVSDVTLTISRRAGAVRIALVDAHPRDPERRPPSGRRSGGRGLAIIDAIATQWGVGRIGDRKVVWAELPADDADHAGHR